MPMKPGREPLSISWFPPRNSCPQIPFLREGGMSFWVSFSRPLVIKLIGKNRKMIFLKLQHSLFPLSARGRLKNVKQRSSCSRELWGMGFSCSHPRRVSHAPPAPSSADTEGQSWTAEGQEAFSAASPGTSPQTMGSEPQDGTCVQSSRRSTDASQQNGQTSLRRAGGRQSVPPMSACQPGHVSLSSSSAHRSSGAGAGR
ncbi:uncharacterized protein LOC116596172 isoform X4 [Mustela erminea]|uniref:uncharacterized protein LOC116596172 isoform X4 n=1 Tax=Mustela erminea TaxID=36723 RepID=UPI001386FD74|nr:uncharacterized protein LOC116596172 isoform X4 [Mustela erminea]